MKDLNVDESKIDLRDLSDDVKEYVNLRITLMRLNVTEKISGALAKFISAGAVILLAVLFFVFASIGLAYWLGTVLENTALGFVSVAGFYLILAIIIHLWSGKGLKPSLTNMFINDFSNDDDDDDKK